MAKKEFPKSMRKYIRKEKARIRREIFGEDEQNKAIQKLYEKIRNSSQREKSS
ncbi:hypothetical protein ACFL3E_01435 [Patescibacteria group bacterium]